MMKENGTVPEKATVIDIKLTKGLAVVLSCVLVVVALGAAPVQPGRAVLAEPAGGISAQELLNPDGTLDLSTGFQGALDLYGWEVTLNGERGPVLRQASVSAAASATDWNALTGEGLNSSVFALAVVGSDLYVGGAFTQTGDGSLDKLGCIARYDTAAHTWHALSNDGLNGTVQALAVVGSDLYAGGWFTQTGDGLVTNLGYIARYDITANTWHALPLGGLNDAVYALAVSGSDLYVGGYFTHLAGARRDLNHIARYDTAAKTWHALPNPDEGLDGPVYALALSGSHLYVGGSFSQTADASLSNLGNIARYDAALASWDALSSEGLNSTVTALAVSGSDLYVGGVFTQTGDGAKDNLGNIARYSTVAKEWHELLNEGLNASVFELAVVGDDLYVGGNFAQTGDGSLEELGRIARYDTAAKTWHALSNQGLNGMVHAVVPAGSGLYVGGVFTQTGDHSLTKLGRIAGYGLYPYKVYLPLALRE